MLESRVLQKAGLSPIVLNNNTISSVSCQGRTGVGGKLLEVVEDPQLLLLCINNIILKLTGSQSISWHTSANCCP